MSTTVTLILTILLALFFLIVFVYSFLLIFTSGNESKNHLSLKAWRHKIAALFRHDKIRRA